MKKENLFEFVKKNIEHGHWVALEHVIGGWKVFLYVDGNGELQGTVHGDSIEECISLGLVSSEYCKERIKEEFTTNYKILPQKPKPLKVGDRVEVLEIAGEEFAGHKFEIMEVNDDDHGVYYRDKECYIFKHCEVAPVMEEDTHQQLNVKHCEKCGGDGKIFKRIFNKEISGCELKRCPDCKGTGHVVNK